MRACSAWAAATLCNVHFTCAWCVIASGGAMDDGHGPKRTGLLCCVKTPSVVVPGSTNHINIEDIN
jgi:hypothetical protein